MPAPRLGPTWWRRLAASLQLAALLGLNAVAWMQAWAMTHYSSTGQRTAQIEALSPREKIAAVLTGVSVPRPLNDLSPQQSGLTYKTRLIEISEGEFLEAWYVPHPQPHGTVLMFPGYAESKESLLSQAVAFHDLGYACFLVDFRGSGGSSGQETTLGVREAEDVAIATAYVWRNWPSAPVVLYGVSMGGVAVLRAVAMQAVQPAAVIVESPFDRLVSTVCNRFHAMGLPGFPNAELLVFWGSVQHQFNGFAHNPIEYAGSVKCPVLIMHGENDPRVTVEQATSIYENLHGQKELVVFPRVGHESLLAANPAQWREQIARFLGP